MKKLIYLFFLCLPLISFGQIKFEKEVKLLDNSIKISVIEKDGKLPLTFIKTDDSTKKMEDFADNLNFQSFEKLVISYFVEKLKLDTNDSKVINEIHKIAINIYSNLPTNPILKEKKNERAILLLVKKHVPLYSENKDAYKVQYRLEAILNSIEAKRQEFIEANKKYNYVTKEKMSLPIIEDKTKAYFFKLPDTFKDDNNYEIKNNNFDYTPLVKNYKPNQSILKGINYTEEITDGITLKIHLNPETVKKLFSAATLGKPTTIEATIETNIPASSTPLYKSLSTVIFDNYLKLENYKRFNSAEWELIKPMFKEGLASASYDEIKALRNQIVSLFETNNFDPILIRAKRINSLSDIEQLTKDLNINNDDHLELNKLLMNFIEQYESTNSNMFDVDNFQLVIKDGVIEDIKVSGKLNGKNYYFENRTPIGFSSKTNFRNLNKHSIYETKNLDGKHYEIKLENLLDLDYDLALQTKDFSPDDINIKEEITEDNHPIYLFRDSSAELLDIKVFADIKGISEDEPNGLIQIEVAHNFKLWSTKKQLWNSGMFIGVVSNIRAFALLSKIEKKLRYLPMYNADSIVNGQLRLHKFAPAIDFYKYQTFQLGCNLNALQTGHDNIKTRLYLNLGLSYVGTYLNITTLRKVNNRYTTTLDTSKQFAGSFLISPELKLQLLEVKQIGGEFGFRHNCMWLLNRDVSYSENENYQTKNKAHFETYFGELFYKPYNKSKLYARVTWNVQNTIYKKHFWQLQIGYYTNLSYL